MKLLNIKYFSYFIFFIGLYIGGRYAVYFTAVFVVIAIISLVTEGVKPIRSFPKILLIPIGFYLLHIISVFYSSNIDTALFDLQVKFSFLLLPVLFGLQKNENKVDLVIVLKLFSIATIIACSSLLWINYQEYTEIGYWNHYMLFSIFLHPSYLSMYLVFNMLSLFYLVSNKQTNIICASIGLLLSIITLYFADSKAGMLVLIITAGFIGFKLLYKKSKLLAFSTSVFVIIGITVLFSYSNRFQSLKLSTEKIENILENPEDVMESTALRILVWSASFDVIKQHPLIGVGNGDVKKELSIIYNEKKYKEPLLIQMNSHNQYLETTVGLGILGLLSLLLMLLFPFLFIKERSMLIKGFILIIATNILVESMFNTQAGVLFIIFFYSFLLSHLQVNRNYYQTSVSLEPIG